MLINLETSLQAENDYIVKTVRDMKKNSYRPGFHYKKRILTIIACHANTEIKYNTSMKNIKYLN